MNILKIQQKASVWIVVIVLGLCMVGSLAGVVLGAINFVSPTTYPAWLLVTWLVTNVLIGLVVLVNIVWCVFVCMPLTKTDDDISALLAISIVPSLAIIIGSWLLLTGRHFGWFSIWALVILIALTIIDFTLITSFRSDSVEG